MVVPDETWVGDVSYRWYNTEVESLSHVHEMARIRARALLRRQRIRLRVLPIGRFWVIEDTGMKVKY